MANNAKEIADEIKALMEPGGVIHEKLADTINLCCIGVEGSAKRRAPVKTGNLHDKITHKVDRDALEGVVGTNEQYAPYVEIGTGIYSSMGNGRQTPWIYVDPKTGEKIFTRGSYPHPFLKPALEENIDTIKKYFENCI